jgi:hypothetical protein
MLVAFAAALCGAASSPPVRVIEPAVWSDAVAKYRAGLTEGRPELRGFRMPLLADAATVWPIAAPGPDASVELRNAAEYVAQHLAMDGLLATAAEVIATLGPARFVESDAAAIDLLKQTGLPVDLLRYFPKIEAVRQDAPDDGLSIVRFAARQLESGVAIHDLRRSLAAVAMRFQRSCPELEIMSESGETPIGALRLQLTRGTDWGGAGDGGSVDLLRQLIADLPDTEIIASIERRHVDDLMMTLRNWPLRAGELTLIAEPFTISQWVQDNGKAGLVQPASATDGAAKLATLVPRYASRGEDGSTFVPGESFLVESLQQLGQVVIQSPLIFQGGNTMVVRDPASGARVLLLGEAEVYRNTALGLTPEQVVAAFGIEFGVDRCSVLSAVSFHLDYEVSVRAHDGTLIAFVNEPRGAVAMILAAAAHVLHSHGALSAAQATEAGRLLERGELAPAVDVIAPALWSQADRNRHFPLSVAKWFSIGAADSGVGNLQRVLLALDMVVAWSVQAGQVTQDGHSQAYLLSLQRLDADRAALRQRLEALGFKVVPIPSMGDGRRSVNYLNGIHEPGRYLMPAYGGLFAGLDQAAAEAFSAALVPSQQPAGAESGAEQVQILAIRSSESQRRAGALRCSAAAYPRVTPAVADSHPIPAVP